jgi:hypothetical protein
MRDEKNQASKSTAGNSRQHFDSAEGSTEKRHPEDSDDSESCAELVKLVDRIHSRETDGMAELDRLFSNSIRFYLCQQLGPQEMNDKVHDTFVIVVEAIQLGELRDASRLMGFIRTIARRQVSLHIDNVVQTRRRQMDLDATVRLAHLRRNPEESDFPSEVRVACTGARAVIESGSKNPNTLLPAGAERRRNLC